MRTKLTVTLVLLLILATLTACGGTPAATSTPEATPAPTIEATPEPTPGLFVPTEATRELENPSLFHQYFNPSNVYSLMPETVYSTPASENGLGDTGMYFYGVVEEIDDSLEVTTVRIRTAHGVVYAAYPDGTDTDVAGFNLNSIIGSGWENLRVGGEYFVYLFYNGFSTVYQAPAGIFMYAVAANNGEIPKVVISAEVVQSHLYVYNDRGNRPNAYYVAEIINTGSDTIEVSGVSIDLEDVSGSLIATSQYASARRSTINPGESAYICESMLASNADVDISTIGRAILHFDVAKVAPTALDITITEVSVSADTYPKVIGRATNNSDEATSSLTYIAIVFTDPGGNIQAVGSGTLAALNPGDTKGFSQTIYEWNPNISISDSTVTVIPYTLNFNFSSGAKVSYSETTEVSAPVG